MVPSVTSDTSFSILFKPDFIVDGSKFEISTLPHIKSCGHVTSSHVVYAWPGIGSMHVACSTTSTGPPYRYSTCMDL